MPRQWGGTVRTVWQTPGRQELFPALRPDGRKLTFLDLPIVAHRMIR